MTTNAKSSCCCVGGAEMRPCRCADRGFAGEICDKGARIVFVRFHCGGGGGWSCGVIRGVWGVRWRWMWMEGRLGVWVVLDLNNCLYFTFFNQGEKTRVVLYLYIQAVEYTTHRLSFPFSSIHLACAPVTSLCQQAQVPRQRIV
jgi:hypothetical protein